MATGMDCCIDLFALNPMFTNEAMLRLDPTLQVAVQTIQLSNYGFSRCKVILVLDY